MVNAVRHDPYRLFEFARSENDWVLADLLARRLGIEDVAVTRLARLTRDLGLEGDRR